MTFEPNKQPETRASVNTSQGEVSAISPQSSPATITGKKKALSPSILIVAALLIALASYFIGRGSAVTQTPKDGDIPAATADKGTDGGEAPTSETAADKAAPITLEGEAARTAGVKAVPVRFAAFGESLTVPGTVEVSPNRGARVTPPVSGKVLSLFAVPGDQVAEGQRLALLDSPEVAQAHAAVREAQSRIAEAKAQVQTAQAGIEQAQTKLGSARSALQRQRELALTGAFSQPSLQAAQNELNTAQSELAQAKTDAQAQAVIVERSQRLFDAQLVAKAELEQSQLAKTQAQTRVDQTEKRVALAQQTLDREQRVFRGGLLNRQPVQTAEAEVRAAEGDVRQARKQEQATRTSLAGAQSGLAAAQANLRAVEGEGHSEGGAGRLSLHAPIGGTVATRGVTIGQAVERSSELFTIQNLQTVVVEANIPEASVSRVRVGAPVTVTVPGYPNARFTGVVQGIGSQVDEKTRALPVRCLVQNKGGALKPEMFARVTLATGGKSQALTVPDAAVDEDGDKRFVYIQTAADTYEKREVTLGRISGNTVEIVKGVKAGESVATDGLFVLKSESKKDELKGDED
jgi:cobalt-zinc-cadmium efflux system membrane fusion protein